MKRTLTMAPLVAAALCCSNAFADPSSPSSGTLAFVSIRDGNPHIYVKNGVSAEQQLTQGKAANSQPAWSADGSQLAFTSTREGLIKVFVMNADGTAQKRLTSDDRIESAPSWSPDGKSLAFYSSDKQPGAADLRIIDLQNGKVTAITGNGRDKGPTQATWSADGLRLSFTGYDEKQRQQVWVVERDGSGLREVSSKFSARDKAFAALSPDGRRVAYSADMRGAVDLIVTDLDTLESKNITATGTATKHENPRWSADGRQLLFGSTRDDAELVRMDIFVMNADGTGMRNLTRHPHEDFDARWSADGRSVVFTSLRTGTGQLYAVDLASATTQRLMVNASHDMDHAPRPIAGVSKQMTSLNRHHSK